MNSTCRSVFSVIVAVLTLCFSFGLQTGAARAEDNLNVLIQVKNELNIPRVNEPVTGGVPIPEQYQIFSCESLNIVDESGVAVPSQFSVTARWGGSPVDGGRPVKWVLVTFLANLSPLGTGQYFLKSGFENQTSTGLEIVSDTADAITIQTGKARFVVSRKRFNLFDSVMVDNRIITQDPGDGIVLTDDQGRVYTSTGNPPSSVVVKERGPVRVTLEVKGGLSNLEGDTFLDYTAILYFYADSSSARLLLTIGNHRMALPKDGGGYDVFDYFGQNSVSFEEASCRIRLYSPEGGLSYLYPSDTLMQSGNLSDISIYQDSSGTDYWDRYIDADHPRTNSYCTFRGYRVTDGTRIIDGGDHFSGWMDISDGEKGMSVGMIDFWQSFPKALSASPDGRVVLKFFPAEYAGSYNFRVGEEKTTGMFFYFHDGTAAEADAAQTAQALSRPMMALAPADWYIGSDAMQKFARESTPLEARFGMQDSSDDILKYSYYNDRTLIADPLYTGPDSDYYPYDALWISSNGHPASIDYFNFYGWAWWGNQPLDFEAYGDGKAGPFNAKYQFDLGAWLQFLRTGDYRWKGMAEAFTKHLEMMVLNEVSTEEDTERWRNAVFGMSAHQETGNENGDRNHLGPVMDTCFGAPGALLHYYLTGYPVSKRFVSRVGEYAYDFYATTRRYEASPYLADSFYSDGTRVMGNLLTVLNQAFRYSGDRKYQALAQDIMDWFAPENQPWINGPVPGNEEFIAPLFLMLYVNAMGEYAFLARECPDLEAESRLAEERVVAFINWLLAYGSFESEGWLTTWYHYNLNGTNSYNSDMVNNWMLEFADACAYAYAFTGDPNYLDAASRFFHTGVNNPFYINSPLTYSDVKEAVNHAVFGHVYLYYAQSNAGPPPENTPPVAGIKIAAASLYTVGVPLTFDGSGSYDPDGDPLTYTWTFGDGGEPAGGPLVQHVYQAAGDYTVTLRVSDGRAESSARETITISSPGSDVQIVLQQGTPFGAAGAIYSGTRDAYIRRAGEYEDGNYGACTDLINYNGLQRDYCALVRFDLDGISLPEDAEVVSARLEMYPGVKQTEDVCLSPLLTPWQEGSGTWGNTHDGASWYTTDGENLWQTPGGDYDRATDYGYGPNGIAAKAVETQGLDTFDITSLVNAWLKHDMVNNGMILFIPHDHSYTQVTYYSKDEADVSRRPRLVITCHVPESPGDINFVKNPEADEGLEHWNTRHGDAHVDAVSGNCFFVLDSGNIYQDISLAGISEITSGSLIITVSAKMKADMDHADQGNPYILTYLFGTKESTNKINTYLSTNTVSGMKWEERSVSCTIPAYTSSIRLFLKASRIKKARTTSGKAYFDAVCVTIQRSDGSFIYP